MSDENNGVVGRKVRKAFEGVYYDGEVKGVEGEGDELVYSILYSDGDEEDIDAAELASILVPLEPANAPSPRSPKKRPRHDEPPPPPPAAAVAAATGPSPLPVGVTPALSPTGLNAALSPADEKAAAQTKAFATFLETLVADAKSRHQPGGGELLQAALGGAEVEADFDEEDEEEDDDAEGSGGGKMEEEDEEDEQDDEERTRTSSMSPVLTAAELAKLQQRVSSCAHWSLVPMASLTGILSYLDAHVSEGLNTHLLRLGLRVIKEDEAGFAGWVKSGMGYAHLGRLKNALLAASITLSILTAPKVDRKLVSEERVEACVRLLKHVVIGMLAPVIEIKPAVSDGKGKGKGKGKGRGKGKGKGRKSKATEEDVDAMDEDEFDEDGQDADDEVSGANGSSSNEPTREGVRPMAEALVKLCESHVVPLMGHLEILVQSVRLDDQVVLVLSSAALALLPLDCVASDQPRVLVLQVAALGLLQSLFGYYDKHRQPMLDDLFQVVLKLPTGKRHLRTFRLHHFSKVVSVAVAGVHGFGTAAASTMPGGAVDTIQVFSALTMLLIQSCVRHDATDSAAGVGTPRSITRQDSFDDGSTAGPLRPAYKAAYYLVKSFLQRCQKREEGAEYRPLLVNLVDDLLASFLMPDWPAAETLLQTLCKALAEDLMRATNADSEESAREKDKDAAGKSHYLSLALDLLGRICTRLRGVVRQEREHPMVLPEAVEAIEDALPSDETETVGCPCGRGVIRSQFMLDCDRCHRWFHGVCVAVSEDDPPKEWFCDDCQITKQVVQQKQVLAHRRELVRQQQAEQLALAAEEAAATGNRRKSKAASSAHASAAKKARKSRQRSDSSDEDEKPLVSPSSRGKKGSATPTKAATAVSDAEVRIGAAVRKRFAGYGWYDGQVNAKDGDKYTITYSEGSTESMSFAKLYKILVDREDALVEKPEITATSTATPMELESTGGGVAEDRSIVDNDVFRQLLLNYLTERARSEAWMGGSRQYHIARWIQDYTSSTPLFEEDDDEEAGGAQKPTTPDTGRQGLRDHFMDQWELPESAVHREDWDITLNTMGTARVVRKLVVTGVFVAQFDQLLNRLLTLLNNSSPTLRARVIKSIAAIVEADPVLMANENVRKAIIQRFYDGGISVRQAAVDLVGRYALLSEPLFDHYFEALDERLMDKGVSVRKAVVKILRDALLAHPNYHNRAKICRKLVHRASAPKEEDSIKDLIHATFQRLWFDSDAAAAHAKTVSSTFTAAVAVATPGGAAGAAAVAAAAEGANPGLESLPAGWRCEAAEGGVEGDAVFVSPSGHRCLSLNEALLVAQGEESSLGRSVTPAALQAAGAGTSAGGGGRKSLTSSARANAAKALEDERCAAAAAQMVEVVHGASQTSWLVSLLEGLLYGAGEGNKKKWEQKKLREDVLSRCKALVASMVEFLIKLDEGYLPLSVQKPAAAALAADATDPAEKAALSLYTEASAQLVATIATLHVFCKASPDLLVPHLSTLLPYLKADNGVKAAEESLICTNVANMVAWTMPLAKEEEQDLQDLRAVVEDLRKIIYKFGSPVVHAAVEGIVIMTQRVMPQMLRGRIQDSEREPRAVAAEPLLALMRVFYGVLLKGTPPGVKLDQKGRANSQRGLVVLGYICRYCSFEDLPTGRNHGGLSAEGDDYDAIGGEGAPLLSASELTPSTSRPAIYAMFRAYLAKPDTAMVDKALQGLASLLIGAPRLMLVAEKDGLVGKVLAHPESMIRLQALRCCCEILEAEEHRIESGMARRQLDEKLGMAEARESSGDGDSYALGDESDEDELERTPSNGGPSAIKRQVQGDQDGESSVVGGVLQIHLYTTLRLLFEKDAELRSAATQLLGVMLRQGLVNPLEVLPHIVALLGDRSPDIRAEALRLLLVEDEKHPDFLKTRMLEGLCVTFQFQKKIFGSPAPLLQAPDVTAGGAAGSTSNALSVFSGVYASCIRANRSKRVNMLRGLLGLFNEKRAKEVSDIFRKLEQPKDAKVTSTSTGSNGKHKRHVRRASTHSDGKKDPLNLEFLGFVAQTLAHLPYDVQEEPLFIIYTINRFVTYEGSSIVDSFKKLLKSSNVAINDSDDDEPGPSSDAMETVSPATSNSSSSSIEKSAEKEDGVDHAALRSKCEGSIAVCMLVRLKNFLKHVYQLKDAKCESYEPNTTAKTSERPIFRPDALPDLRLPDMALLVKAELSADEMVALYSQLKRMMAEEPADFKLSTAKPGSKRGRKASAPDMDVDPDMPEIMREAGVTAPTPKAKAKGGKKTTAKKKAKKRRKKTTLVSDSENDAGAMEDSEDSDYNG